MCRSCRELERQYGQSDCKCARYREYFPDCECERESVSPHSPGRVEDDEVLVRTLFSETHVDLDGRPKPAYFRSDPGKRGMSVDRMRHTDPEALINKKTQDGKYGGYLAFLAANSGRLRELEHDDGRRLFCLYDSATSENIAHADICQNVYLESCTPRRKPRMMAIAWRLRDAFGVARGFPPTSLDN